MTHCRRTSAAARGFWGFTFIELLATVVLIAIILPTAMKGISLATSVGSISKNRREAAALAESKLIELIITGNWKNSSLSGDFGEDYPKYRWEAEVGQWADPSLQELTLRVEWNAQNKDYAITLTTLIYTGDE